MAAPRSVDQRIVDTRQRLEHDVDAWVATTSPDRPWLIPLSFLWHEDRLLFATNANSPTAVNIGLVRRVRVALGTVRDVVIIDGDADLAPSATLSSAEVEAYTTKHNSEPGQTPSFTSPLGASKPGERRTRSPGAPSCGPGCGFPAHDDRRRWRRRDHGTSGPSRSPSLTGHRSRYGTTKTMFVPGLRSLRACP